MTRGSVRGSRARVAVVVWFAGALASVACRRPEAQNDSHNAAPAVRPDEPAAGPAVPFDVRAERTDLTYFWFDEPGTPHPVQRID